MERSSTSGPHDADPGPSVANPAARGAPGPRRPGNPDDTALGRVLAELEDSGWVGQLQALAGGRIRCLTCREEFDASQVDADAVRRLEGASDPDDDVIVVPVVCPNCSTRAVLVAHYGPEASAEEADVVFAMHRRPREGRGTGPASSA